MNKDTDILYELRRTALITRTISNQFNEAVCYNLYNTESKNIWDNFNRNKPNFDLFLRELNEEQKKIFSKWSNEVLNLETINNASKNEEKLDIPQPKLQFMHPSIMQLITEAQEKANRANRVEPPKPAPRPQQVNGGHAMRSNTRHHPPANMIDFVSKQLNNQDSPIRQAFFNKIERVRKSRENK